MKKKEILMICFVLLVTALSLFTILQYSSNSSNSTAEKSSTEIKNNTSTTEQANTSNGPTVIDQKNVEDKKTSASTNDKEKSTSANTTTTNTSDEDSDDKNDEDADEETSNSKTSTEKYITYTVKKGETLSSIVKAYEDKCPTNILSKVILEENKLSKSSDIKEGLQIKIPEKYTNGSKYTVKAGDSLYSVALSKFDDVNIYSVIDIIKKDNFLSSDNIKVGDQLFITSSITNSSVASTKAGNNDEDSSSTTTSAPVSDKDIVNYKVKDGETLSSIVKKYEKYCPTNVASKVILKLNNFADSKEVKAGVEIKIPEKYLTNGERYTIKQGDSLSAIAGNFFEDLSISKAIDKIMSDNFISSNNIKIGDQLYITTMSLDIEEKD